MTNFEPVDARRQAGWLPPDQDALEGWIAGRREQAASAEATPLHPAVAAFGALIVSDPVLRMTADRMVAQVPISKPYRQRHVQSVTELLQLMSDVLATAPEFSADSMVMTPLAAVLDWTTGTAAGFAFYRDPRVNQALKQILNAWCEYLSGPGSRSVLNDSETGWLSERAREVVGMDQFQHDPDAAHFGFESWNDFFTRRLADGARPVAAPDDDSVIVSACESTPYGLTTGVQARDRFWIKSQPYSLHDLLAGDPIVDELVGGTVYQAFLSATNYHRWHSPVAGTIVRAFLVDGTYYSEADSEGSDATQPTNSQSYLAHVSARAIVVIEADEPAIGRMAFVAVGMVEVSSCVLDANTRPGGRVEKGQELGYFQFGGSTHCLVFRPGAIDGFALQALPRPHDPNPPLVQVRSQIATAARPQP